MKRTARRAAAEIAWGFGVMACCAVIALRLVLAVRTR